MVKGRTYCRLELPDAMCRMQLAERQHMTHENMVQYKPVRTLATILFLPFAAVAARVVVAPMEVSPYRDTEVSTNVAINTWRSDARQVGIRLQLEGTPTNNLEVAFGRDANRNGVLDMCEVDAVYGWRGGAENRTTRRLGRKIMRER